MPCIVGIRFKSVGKIYYFSPKDIEFHVGDGVIVETVRGVECGTIVLPNREVEEKDIVSPLKEVIRKATPKDEEKMRENEAKKPEAMRIAKEKIAKHKLEMKLIDAEFTFDQSKVIFYFTADGRVDFRELVKDLASVFKIRIELRQIGIRDEAKMLGGLGACGRPCCCSSYLGDFQRVSIKMAKVQGLSLNPSKISGLCGRLMCCLQNENEHYAETAKLMPKLNSEVKTPQGKGIVAENDLLRREVTVRFTAKDGGIELKKFPLAEIRMKKTVAEEIDASPDSQDLPPEEE